jgi:hypothetical protein
MKDINAIKLKQNWNNSCLEFGINMKNPSIGFSTRVRLWQALFQMTTHLKLYLRRKKTSKEAKTWTRKEKFWFNFFFAFSRIVENADFEEYWKMNFEHKESVFKENWESLCKCSENSISYLLCPCYFEVH